MFWSQEQNPNAIGSDEDAIRSGTWYHDDKRTPLTKEELRRFKLDLERDAKAGRSTSTGTAPYAPGMNFAESADKTKKPIDLNATSKRSQTVSKYSGLGRGRFR